MSDKDAQLIWEQYKSPGRVGNPRQGIPFPDGRGEMGEGSFGPPLTVYGASDEDIEAAKADPESYMYSVEYDDNWDRNRLQREIDMEYQGGEMDGWDFTGEEDTFELGEEKASKDIGDYFDTISALIAGGKANPDATTHDTMDDIDGVNALAQEFMGQTARPSDQDDKVKSDLQAVENALYELHATLADYVESNKSALTDFAYDGDER